MIPALALGGCKSVLEIPVVETGWDIYTGGQYRYDLPSSSTKTARSMRGSPLRAVITTTAI